MYCFLKKEKCRIRIRYARDWREPTKEEFDDIYHEITEEVYPEIIHIRIREGKSIVHWRLGRYNLPYEIKFLIS